MGLYVSWGIVAKLGGLITVESQVGQGTTFTIMLPVKK
jgi:signal transduction histidine kinase